MSNFDLVDCVMPFETNVMIINLLPMVDWKSPKPLDDHIKYYSMSKGGHSRQSSRSAEKSEEKGNKERFFLNKLLYVPVHEEKTTQSKESPKNELAQIWWGKSFHQKLQQTQLPLIKELKMEVNMVLIPAQDPPCHRVILESARNEKLEDEELRIAGFYHFCEQVLSIMQVKSNLYTGVEQLGIKMTTSLASHFAWSDLKRREEEIQKRQQMLNELPKSASPEKSRHKSSSSLEGVMPLRRESDNSLVAAMMQNPLIGVGMKNRRWHLTTYPNAIVGHDVVDWILKFFEDVNSRDEAIELGQRLMDSGVLFHVHKGHRFLDGYYYYQFREEYKSGGKYVKEAMVLEPTLLAKSLEQMKISSRVPLVLILAHPDNTQEAASVRMYYDAVQNPNVCFHISFRYWRDEVELLEKMQAMFEKAKLCGFNTTVQMLNLSLADEEGMKEGGEGEGEDTFDEIRLLKNRYLDMEPDEAYPNADRLERALCIFEKNPYYLYVDQLGREWLLIERDKITGKINLFKRLINGLAEE